jgi:hypothetical protein
LTLIMSPYFLTKRIFFTRHYLQTTTFLSQYTNPLATR